MRSTLGTTSRTGGSNGDASTCGPWWLVPLGLLLSCGGPAPAGPDDGGGGSSGGSSAGGAHAGGGGAHAGGGGALTGGGPLGGSAPGGGAPGGAGGALPALVLGVSFEADGCAAEGAGFGPLTSADCDATVLTSDGLEAARFDASSGEGMLVSHGAFELTTGELWLSYDLYAPSQPTFTIMMEGWTAGASAEQPDNPWYNRNPFSLEWRDGWFAMNCDYPNDHGTERRSEQVTSPLGVGAWVNVVVHYDLDAEVGGFWLRALDGAGQPTTPLALDAPTGSIDCAALGDRGAVRGLSMTDFQSSGGGPAQVFTDRWILATDVTAMP